MSNKYDVLIMGGGLAGLTLARQLLLANQTLHILILERRSHPAPEAAFKVGESTVEVGAHYLASKLQLEAYMKERHLPKAGLRFFFSDLNNLDISKRIEFGAVDFPPAPSYQVDRGRFENDLRDMVIQAGATVLSQARVQKVHLDEELHRVEFICENQLQAVKTKWVVDASGRSAILKRELGLSKPMDHFINASWFRINSEIDISQWRTSNTTQPHQDKWKNCIPEHIRHLSTCHLMGKGYWVWLIPLSSKTTSVGIVADEQLYPHGDIFTFEKSLQWLYKHEPQLAAVIEQSKAERMDFRTLKYFSHNIKQVFSSQRWAITGEAGAFVDPFYSPGTDCIAMSNDFVADLILRDFKGEDIDERASRHNFLYLKIIDSLFQVYQQQYPLMGNAQVMLTKITWDYACYWGGIGLLFFANKLTDMAFMKQILREFGQLSDLNGEVQALFRTWQPQAKQVASSVFIDTLSLSFLYELNCNLTQYQDDNILSQLQKNLVFLQDMANAIKLHIQNTTDLEFNAISKLPHEDINVELNKLWFPVE